MKSDWTVLIVEDSADDRELLAQIFEHYDIEVYFAQNGQDCLSMLDDVHPTLILMDLQMPIQDGWSTLNSIRARSDTKNLPVVAITAYYSGEVEKTAFEMGFDGCLDKPPNPTQLVEQLAIILNN